MDPHWILRDSKYPQVSMILHSILADLNNAVVWIVFNRPHISRSSSPYISLWCLYQERWFQVLWPPLSCSTVFFRHLTRSSYIPVFSLFFNSTLSSGRTAKSTILQVLFSCFFFHVLVLWLRLDDPYNLLGIISRRA